MTHAVFTPAILAGIPLKNRIIRSATHEGLADGRGAPTKKLAELYGRLARGGPGAVITGYTGVMQNGKSFHHNMLMIDNDDLIDAYRPLADAVHEHDTPIILQVAHCGRQTRRAVTGEKPVAPSAIRDRMFSEEIPHELSEAEIDEIIDRFVTAVGRAAAAGIDGVQLHAAHGYLLSSFLSDHTNRRTDRWGGSLENRFRILGEILNRARKKHQDYPILVKLNGHDGRKHGMTPDEAAHIARMLQDFGCDGIEVSCGTFEDGFYGVRGGSPPIDAVVRHTFKFEAVPRSLRPLLSPVARLLVANHRPVLSYNRDAARIIKNAVDIPVIIVGGMHRLQDIADVVDTNDADFVSLCRPFIIEPNIVKKLQEGKKTESACIQCNYCAVMQEDRALKCYYGKLPKE